MKWIAYYRVSTQKQADSRAGLEAQATAVERHLAHAGGKLVASYTEIESGGKNDRPQLAAALTHAKTARATLIVGKLDRLARSCGFVCQLLDSGVEILACDNPHVTRLTLQILAAVAEQERQLIRSRTREALASRKARGVLLGSRRPGAYRPKGRVWQAIQRRGHEAKTANANSRAREIGPEAVSLRGQGLTLERVAEAFNVKGYETARGKTWTPKQVQRLLQRVQQLQGK